MDRLGLRGRAAVGFAASCAVAIVVSLATAGALLTGGLQAGDDGEYLTEALRELGAERGVDASEIAPLLDLALDDAPVGLDDVPSGGQLDTAQYALLDEALNRAEEKQFDATVVLFAQIAVGVAIAGTLAAGAVAWTLMNRLLGPVEQLSLAAADAAVGDLSQRIRLDGPNDELKRLADTFDDMLEQLEASFERQRQFSANAAHELRTPLAVIRAELDAVRSTSTASPEQLEFAEAIDRATTRAEGLVTALLQLGKAEAGVRRMDKVDLGEVVGDVVQRRIVAFTSAGLQIELDLGEGDTAQVDGDTALLDVMALNLIDNALNHSRPDTTVDVSVLSEADGSVTLIVCNEADGLDDDLLSLTDPYRRGRHAERGHGHGVGLAIVQAVVSAHNATLSIEQLNDDRFRVSVQFAASAVSPGRG
ncbi:MAG: sensor histidine kinase [Acidimicrobiales bacterium]